jgi:hypothetical protein
VLRGTDTAGQDAPLPYEPSSYESARQFAQREKPWTSADLAREISHRANREKQRRELDVNYYRIGFRLAFPLPLSRRPMPEDLPAGIPTMKYPWLIWLSWELEERWRVLHAAWRQDGDTAAGALLQRELAALATWENFLENNNQTGLVTGHLAGCLALALGDPHGWDAALLAEAQKAARSLLDRDIKTWFAKTWPAGAKLTPAKMANIPVIALVRAAQLARVLGHPLLDPLDARSLEVLRAWRQFRMGPEKHTEGTAYDGYLFDSVSEWLAALPARTEILRTERAALRSLADEWISLTLPARFDLHVPLGDVEAEMVFWSTVLARLGGWYEWRDAGWLLARFPLSRFPAAALTALREHRGFFTQAFDTPAAAARELPHVAALRTGWTADAPVVAVSLSRGAMGHLHADGGQIIFAWHGRSWITDPGYQQYKAGTERDYTLGPRAHNAPVIGGAAQKSKAAELLGLATAGDGSQRVTVELTKGYALLPVGATVVRSVWHAGGETPTVVVRDSFGGLAAGTEIDTSWLGGAHLAWAFVNGWARLSDGEHALWIGTTTGPLRAAQLEKTDGSRGPLTISQHHALGDGRGEIWWAFVGSAATSWTPPVIERGDKSVVLTTHGDRPLRREITR